MIKRIIEYTFFAVCLLCIASCKKEIVADDIYAYWALQNEVEFKGVVFTHLEFTDDEKWGSWVDPVTSDTIYHYNKLTVTGDSLCLTDDNGKELICRINELHDSTLVITDFPGANKRLEFKRVGDVRRYLGDDKPLFKYGMCSRCSIEAKCFPKDSLDINIKSYYSLNKYNYEGKSQILSNEQVQQAHKLLEDYIVNKDYVEECMNGIDDAYPFDEYFKQYSGCIVDGELIVNVSLLSRTDTMFSPFPYMELKEYMSQMSDGGPQFARAKINLTKQKVLFFMTNGPHMMSQETKL